MHAEIRIIMHISVASFINITHNSQPIFNKKAVIQPEKTVNFTITTQNLSKQFPMPSDKVCRSSYELVDGRKEECDQNFSCHTNSIKTETSANFPNKILQSFKQIKCLARNTLHVCTKRWLAQTKVSSSNTAVDYTLHE